MPERLEWHIIGARDEMTPTNGSAVLSVAWELANAARNAGTESWVIGGRDVSVVLPWCKGITQQPDPSAFHRGLDLLLRFWSGHGAVERVSLPGALPGLPGIVFAHNLPWEALYLKKHLSGARVVLYAHNRLMSKANARSIRRALDGFDDVVFVSEFLRSDLRRRGGFREEVGHPRMHVVRNSCRTAPPSREVVEPSDVVFAGRLVPEKGVHVLIDAMGQLPEPATLTILGGKRFYPTDRLSRYERGLRLRAKGLGGLVRFVGPVSPGVVRAHMDVARVVAVPSVWAEPCSLALMEGMASSAAVVAARVGGIQEMESTGGAIFVAPGRAEPLAGAIAGLLGDESSRTEVAQRGRSVMASRSWAAAYSELERWLRE